MQAIRKSKKLILVLNLFFLVLMVMLAYTTVYAVPLAYDLSVDLSPQRVSLLPPYDYPCADCDLNTIGCNWCWAAVCRSGIDYVCSYTSIRSVVASVKGSYICETEYAYNIPSHINSTYGGWGLVSTYYGYKPSSSTVKSYIYNSHCHRRNIIDHGRRAIIDQAQPNNN